MAHELTTRANGLVEMAYVGDKPWHGLGQELQVNQPIETWLTAAGMDWKIKRAPVQFESDEITTGAELKTWKEWTVLHRSDTEEPLGIVSSKFKIVQPQEVLEFFRDLVDVAGFKLETAGTLHGGRKFWAMASINAEDRIVGNDMIRGRLLFATSCDGSMSNTIKNIAERVVCANTLDVALGESGAPQLRITHHSIFNAEKAKRELGVAVGSFERFIATARQLAARRVDQTEAKVFLAKVVGKSMEDAERDDKAFARMMELFNGDGRGARMKGVKDTAWGLVNAVTEFVDHFAAAKSSSNRMDSAWFGRGSKLKQVTFDAAMELID